MAKLHDSNIAWKRKRKWYTPFDFQTFVGSGTSGLVGGQSVGITTLEITSVGMITSVMTDAEIMTGYFPVPIDMDPRFDVGFRVCYTLDHDGTGDATVSWIMLQGTVKEGAAIAIPTTVLNTAIALLDSYDDTAGDASTTDFLLQWTSRGVRTAGNFGLSNDDVENRALITFSLEMDAALNETSVRFMGLEMDYCPHRTILANKDDAPLGWAG